MLVFLSPFGCGMARSRAMTSLVDKLAPDDLWRSSNRCCHRHPAVVAFVLLVCARVCLKRL
jgi:hypothetical protein